jgi:hypothetical protein
MMHHHVFDLRTAIALVEGLQILDASTALPYQIIILARKAPTPDSRGLLAPGSAVHAQSHFATPPAVLSGRPVST